MKIPPRFRYRLVIAALASSDKPNLSRERESTPLSGCTGSAAVWEKMQMRSLLLILLTAGAAVAIDDMSGQPAHARASFSKICTHPVNVSEGVVVAENRCKFVSPKVRIRDHFSEFELLTDGKTARLFCRIAGFRRAVEWPEKSAPSFATMVRLEDRPMKLIDPGEKGHPVFDWIVCRN